MAEVITLNRNESPAINMHLFHHTPGENFTIYEGVPEDGNAALKISSEEEPGVYTVEKFHRPTDRPMGELRQLFVGEQITLAPDDNRERQTYYDRLILWPSVMGVCLHVCRALVEQDTLPLHMGVVATDPDQSAEGYYMQHGLSLQLPDIAPTSFEGKILTMVYSGRSHFLSTKLQQTF